MLLFNGKAFFLKSLKVPFEVVDLKKNLFKVVQNGDCFLVSFLHAGFRTKLFIFSKKDWKSFRSDEAPLVKLKLRRKSKVIEHDIFDILTDYKSESGCNPIKVLVTDRKTRVFVMDEYETELLKYEDTVNGIHIMSEERFIKFLKRYDFEKMKRASIEYTIT